MEMLLWLLLTLLHGAGGRKFCSDRCYPGGSCWPSAAEHETFAKTLSPGAAILSPLSELYRNMTIMKNTRVTRFPAYIIMVATIDDVQKVVLQAQKDHMKIAIQSSGHDYIGRSTADGAIQINMEKMNSVTVRVDLQSSRNPDGEVTVGSGCTWEKLYKEVAKYGRIVLGGSAHTIAMGGYTLGGGHGPLSRMHGLAVDNLVRVAMVTADGSLVTSDADYTVTQHYHGPVHDTRNTDLFWALRGGGGGTFGVVTSFTFRLHKPPSEFVNLYCVHRYKTKTEAVRGKRSLFHVLNAVEQLPNEWGGYLLLRTDPKSGYETITTYLLHYGPWGSASVSAVDRIMQFHPEWQHTCSLRNLTTFWEYEKGSHELLYYRQYIVNTLLQFGDDRIQLVDSLINFIAPKQDNMTSGCTGVLLGGKVSSVQRDSTAVSHNFRSAMMSFTCGTAWADDASLDVQGEAIASAFGRQLLTYGQGVYLNEPPADLPQWKHEFWGNHYDKLLNVKHRYDPHNFFTCLHCVGSDEATSEPGFVLPIVGK